MENLGYIRRKVLISYRTKLKDKRDIDITVCVCHHTPNSTSVIPGAFNIGMHTAS
jgi:hypothetical protein